jgi:hypothetical protein
MELRNVFITLGEGDGSGDGSGKKVTKLFFFFTDDGSK